MKRRIIFLMTLSMMLIGALPALGTTYWLSHCNGELASKSELTFSGAAQVSVATPFYQEEMENYRGNSIVSLRVGIVSRLKLDGLDVWISSAPGSTPIRSAHISKTELQSGWNEVLLNLPLEITGESLYVGYTFTQPSQCNVISLVPSADFYPLMTDCGEGWVENPAGEKGALSIELGIEGDNLTQYDAKIAGFMPLYDEMETGSMAYFIAEIQNEGLEPAETLEYVMESGAAKISRTVHLPGLEPRQKTTLYLKIPIDGEIGETSVTLRLLSVNGQSLGKVRERSAVLTATNPGQTPRRVLLEEFSNEYCGNCPAASEKIREVVSSMEKPGRTDLVVHHAGSGYDHFTVDASKEYESFYSVRKYSPMLAADRTPYGGSIDMVPSDKAAIETRIESALSVPAGGSLWMEPFVDYDRGVVEVAACGTLSETDAPRLTLFLTENNVKSRNQAGATRDYVHHDMLRSVSSVWGEAVSLCSDGSFGQSARLSLLPNWKPEDCRIIAFLTAGTPEETGISKVIQSYSLPLLCAEEKELPSDLGTPTALADRIILSVKDGRLTVTGDCKSVRLFDISGREADCSRVPDGISIVVIELNDGGTIVRKIHK